MKTLRARLWAAVMVMVLAPGLAGAVALKGNFSDVVTKGPWLDVRAAPFAAVANSLESDLGAALNAAIAALPATGGMILIPAGTWYIKTPVVVNRTGVHIRGMGYFATYLKAHSKADTPRMFYIQSTGASSLGFQLDDVFIHGITGHGENYDGIPIEGDLSTGSRFPIIDSSIQNCWFSMSFSTPWCIKGALVFTQIRNNWFELAGGGIYLLGADGCPVQHAMISNNHFFRVLAGVKIDAGASTALDTNVTLANNVFSDHYGGAAVEVVSGTIEVNGLRLHTSRGTATFAGSRNSVGLLVSGGTARVRNYKAVVVGVNELSAKTWTAGDLMHVPLGDSSTNADTARPWSWQCTTGGGGLSVSTTTWPASITTATTVTSGAAVFAPVSLPYLLYGIRVTGSGILDARDVSVDGAEIAIYSDTTGTVTVNGGRLRQGLYGVLAPAGVTGGKLAVTGIDGENFRDGGICCLTTLAEMDVRGCRLRDAGYGQASKKWTVRANASGAVNVVGNHFGVTSYGNAYHLVVGTAATAGVVEDNTKDDALGDVESGLDLSSHAAGVRITAMGTGTPTVGSWPPGSRVVNVNPTEIGTTGWKYVVKGWTRVGTTWLQERTLTGN